MPSPTTRASRSSRSAARPGRSGRPGSTGRFQRTGKQSARPLAPRFTPRGSKPKGKGKSKGVPSGLTGMLPFGKAKAKPSSSGGKGKMGAGLALLTAAAGFAVSNRDKIGGLLKRKQAQPEPAAPMPPEVSRSENTP